MFMLELRKDLQNNKIIVNRISYRPFDIRFMNYTGKTKGIQGYPRVDVMKHIYKSNEIALITCRQQSTFDFQHVFISRYVSDMCNISSQTKETGYVFPLYIYQQDMQLSLDNKTDNHTGRRPNLDHEIIAKIATKIGLKFTDEKMDQVDIFTPVDVMDYIN